MDECKCKPGYYSAVVNASYVHGVSPAADWGAAGACKPCPEGAVCHGLGMLPLTKRGYWVALASPGQPYACEHGKCTVPSGNCRLADGGTVCEDVPFQCAPGYGGRLCKVMLRNSHYRFGFHDLQRCPVLSPDMRRVVTAALFALLLLGFMVFSDRVLRVVPSLDLINF